MPFKIQAKANKSAEISIYGDIGESWWGESVTAINFAKEIAAIDADTITVRINSYGGSVSDGIAIYNAIKRHKATVTCAIDGVAVSIASLIAMAGDVIEMPDNALMMIHAPWASATGNANDLRVAADTLDKFAQAMSSAYANKTGKTTEAVMSWLTDGADHWFTASEAKAENLIDTVTGSLAVAASFDINNFKNRYKTIPAAAGIFQTTIEVTTMPQATQPAASTEPTAATPTQPVNTLSADDIKAAVLKAEAARRTDIKARFAKFEKFTGVSDLLTECLDNSEMSVQAAVEKLHNKLGEGIEPTAVHFQTRVESGESDSEKFAKGATQSILARIGAEKPDPQNEFRSFSLTEVARACLEKSGQSTKGWDNLKLVKSALAMRPRSDGGMGQTTSDFPVLMENVMHRQVLTAYQATPDTWSMFCKTGQVSDFRSWQRLRVGSIGDISDVLESGEYKNIILPDAQKESVKATRKGVILSLTPEIIINDDIGFISDATALLGRSSKRTIENRVYALLTTNPAMTDGIALFHASHGNLAGTAAAPTMASLESARVSMASQKDIGKNDYLDIRPNIWLGSLARGGDARVVINAQYDPDTASKFQVPNKVNGLVSNIVDSPRISGTEWYLFADPTIAPVIEVVFLNGQTEPLLALEEDFSSAGVSYRVELPFGVGVVGYEGAYKNAGV
jgi:ATP-dependent Clp endopeptidase proteolytic subunit ClpP